MRLLDACCKAGGASDGYASAGWQVTGIDIEPQPNYPYRFILGDALEYIWEHGAEYDAIHASWPCQKFTAYRRKGHGVGEGYLNLIPQGRVALISTGKPWIMENVAGAPLRRPVQLCGSSFGLDVRRHRLFESSIPLTGLLCDHSWQTPRFTPASNRTNLRRTVEVGVWRIPLEVQLKAMGVDREVTLNELSNMVPPAYTKYLGSQLLERLSLCPKNVLLAIGPIRVTGRLTLSVAVRTRSLTSIRPSPTTSRS